MYNPLQFFSPVNARFDQAGGIATQIAEQNRLRGERAKQQAGEQRFLGLQQLGQYQPEELQDPQVQAQMEQATMDMLGGGDKYLNYQLLKERTKNVGRRGVTGNAQSIQTAIKAQAPYESKLNILQNELNSMQPTDEGYNEKFNQFQTLMGEHDMLAFNEGQKWLKKQSTMNLQEDFEENKRKKAEEKRKQAEEKRKQGAYANVNFKDFRGNFQEQNEDLIKSSGVAKGIAPLIKSASKGNTQSVATIVKRMSRMASNEAIVMPELQLGFSGNAKDQIKAWGDTYLGSGNRIPEKDLRNIKVAYNAMANQYNDTLGDAVADGVSDWKRYSGKAKGMSTSALKRQMFGKDFKEIPLWTDVVKYKGGAEINPPDTSDKRDTGGIVAPDGMTDRERLDAELLKLMQGE